MASTPKLNSMFYANKLQHYKVLLVQNSATDILDSSNLLYTYYTYNDHNTRTLQDIRKKRASFQVICHDVIFKFPICNVVYC